MTNWTTVNDRLRRMARTGTINLHKGAIMQMFYAGNDKGENGIFFSLQEFAPYRALGWSATPEHNALADAYLLALGEQELSRQD